MKHEIGLSSESAFTKWQRENKSSNISKISYDHRWDDHPSWYTDDKAEQRQMIRDSIRERKENWD